MANESSSKRLRHETTCPVCLNYFVDPVFLDCGHNICKRCIARYWDESGPTAKCPECRTHVERNFRPNRQLARIVEISQAINLPLLEEEQCKIHEEPKDLFCKEDKDFLCLVDARLPKHRGHNVVGVGEAARECKDQLLSCLKTLRMENDVILPAEDDFNDKVETWLKQLEMERKTAVTEFNELLEFLKVRKKRLLAYMKKAEEEIRQMKKDGKTCNVVELCDLGELSLEMEKLCHMPDRKLLKNAGRTLKSYEEKKPFQNLIYIDALQKWPNMKFCDINSFLKAIMMQFKERLDSRLEELETALAVTGDPGKVNPPLTLSKDCKSLTHEDNDQDLPTNRERIYNKQLFVMGYKALTKGKHCWDVLVGSEGEWAVGVVVRDIKLTPEENRIWQLQRWEGVYKVSSPICRQDLSFSGELKRIRVFLNSKGGQLAFYDIDAGALLYVLSEASLSSEALVPYLWASQRACLTLYSDLADGPCCCNPPDQDSGSKTQTCLGQEQNI